MLILTVVFIYSNAYGITRYSDCVYKLDIHVMVFGAMSHFYQW